MKDPFRNYDAWLEAPYQRMAAAEEAESNAWDEFCDSDYGSGLVDANCYDADHPDHAVYVAWCEFMMAIQVAESRREDESFAQSIDEEPDEDILRGGDR